MKLILDIWVADKSGQGRHEAMRKELETDIVPPPGVHFSDRQWNDKPKVPSSVILDIEADWCLLQFDEETYSSAELFDYAIAAYRENGWRRTGEWPL